MGANLINSANLRPGNTQKKDLTLKTFRWSVLVGLLYLAGSLVFTPPKGSGFLAFGIGAVVILLTAISALLFELHVRSMDIKPLYESVQDVHTEQSNITRALSQYTREVNEGMAVGRSLIKSLGDDRKKGIQEVFFRLSNCGPLVREIGTETLRHHVRRFEVQGRVFTAHGETCSLDAYEKCWRKLIEAQRARKQAGDSPLDVRITHSNNIGIWLPERNPRVQELLKQQEEFTKAGGGITRLLLSNVHLTPTEEYAKATQLMRARGIHAVFLYYTHGFHYDFMWVDPVGVLLKWYSGTQGALIARCEITDSRSEIDSVRQLWNSLIDEVSPAADLSPSGADEKESA